MSPSKKRWVAFPAIVVAAVVWDILFHVLAPKPHYLNPSPILLDKTLFVPIVSASLFAAFATIGLVFIRIQASMSGTALRKGLKLAVAFGGLWLIGTPEMSLLFGSPLWVEICGGLADASSLVLLGVLLGRTYGTDSPSAPIFDRSELARIWPVALCWLLLRYLGYISLGIESSYTAAPLGTLLWTAGSGIWIGVMSVLLRPAAPQRGAYWTFSLLVFGGNWAIYTFFAPIFVSGPSVPGIVVRILVDVIAVAIGSALFEWSGPSGGGRRSSLAARS
jgi:hypothetical protein